ncbi:glutaredoxin family protein [Bacillus sp. FJAT-42315]|uniref:glutaredoxin family protein n=1 Tax=Bacillus sp. FJAT-42315 TaxID=2014077 RepID=UPI000BA95D0F|nr:glutaredoxin family protein [Bacillus sp. FJAT-42315]PAQ13574.1 NrdH-redoxin [Bacillaceae bacterium SAOS 7]
MKEIIFYTRPQCPLCIEAQTVLQLVREEVSVVVHERNINDRDEWTEKYGLMIPVIEYDNEIIQYGVIDYPTLIKKLQ